MGNAVEDGGCKIFDKRNKNQVLARVKMERSKIFPLQISYASIDTLN